MSDVVKVYMDNITVCGKDEDDHNTNLKALLEVAEKYDLTFNESKSVFGQTEICILGYCISHNCLKPDPERFRALDEMPIPHNDKALKRAFGMFAYYLVCLYFIWYVCILFVKNSAIG